MALTLSRRLVTNVSLFHLKVEKRKSTWGGLLCCGDEETPPPCTLSTWALALSYNCLFSSSAEIQAFWAVTGAGAATGGGIIWLARMAEVGDSSGMSSAKFVTLNLELTFVLAGIPLLLPLAPCPADPGLPLAEPDRSGKYELDCPETEGGAGVDCWPDTVL